MSTKRPRILYLITKSNFGGAQKYVFELACAAKEQGYEVAVAVGGTGEAGAGLGLLAQKLAEQNITVYPIKNFMRDISWWRDVAAFFEIIRLLRTFRPDILHISSSKAGGLGALAGKISGVSKILFTLHGFADDESWRPRWQQVLIRILTWGTIVLTDRSITISPEGHHKALRMPKIAHKLVCIKNGVQEITFLDRKEAKDMLVPHIPATAFLIGGIGELHPNKNWGALIHALESLPKTVHLVIIGGGQEEAYLTQLATQLGLKERVHLVGYQRDAAKYLQLLDVFVLPSIKEGLPYAVLEAGLARLPVVASDLPGLRDIIDTGMHGLLVEPNKKMLSASLQVLYRDEGMRRRLGDALYERVTRDYSLTRMTTETLALYSSNME